jgi:hypothetical protein
MWAPSPDQEIGWRELAVVGNEPPLSDERNDCFGHAKEAVDLLEVVARCGEGLLTQEEEGIVAEGEWGIAIRKERFRIDIPTADGITRISKLASTKRTMQNLVRITWRILQQRRFLTAMQR